MFHHIKWYQNQVIQAKLGIGYTFIAYMKARLTTCVMFAISGAGVLSSARNRQKT